MSRWAEWFGRNKDVLFVAAIVGILATIFVPLPGFILDFLLVVSITSSILVLLTTIYVKEPVKFSVFPSVLLLTTAYRLALNVATTRQILGNAGTEGTAAAGDVVQAFGNFVAGAEPVIGFVIFAILILVNFIVITKGAGRMAEVGARFALDAMPGKQLAIDSDVSAGAIDHAEARARREREQAETNFFGSLDGASKFVKGDAVAGLLITLLNFGVGMIIGTVTHGMPLGRAFETYAILTVGDGLVTQIPAVITSVGAALLLARGGQTGAADVAFFRQLGRHPGALGAVALLMALLALVPGLPFLPFMAGAAALAALA
jgi:flagellar biosynthesis protein FlhA